jgi:hypothetical protein
MNEEYEDKMMAADMAEAEKVAEFAPDINVKRDTMNRFIKSLNGMLQHFAAPNIGPVESDVDGPMPPDIYKSLMMINAALEDAKMSEYIVNLDDLSDDRDFMMARGKIDTAAKDRAFVAFLRKPMNDEVEVEVEISSDVPEGMHMMPDGSMMADSEHEEEEDIESIMMSRMA